MRQLNRLISRIREKIHFITSSAFLIVTIFLSGSFLFFTSSLPVYGLYLEHVLVSGGNLDQIHPQAAYSGQGTMLVVWENLNNGTSDIYGLIQTNNQQQQATPFPICTAQGDQRSPAVAWNGNSYLVIWEDTRNGNADIYGTRINSTGSVLDSPASQGGGVPICTVGNDQILPALAWNGQDQNYLVIWQDYRTTPAKIYGMRLTANMQLLDGTAANGGLLIAAGGGTNPHLAFNGTGYLVVWEYQTSESSCDIYGCRISPSGQVTGSPAIPICIGEDLKFNPMAVSDGLDFLVVWDVHLLDNFTDIAGILVSADGTPDSRGPFFIAEALQNQTNPSATWCGNHYLVAWKDGRFGKPEICSVRLSSAGSFLDSQSRFSDSNLLHLWGFSRLDSPVAAIYKADTKEYMLLWEENQTNNYDIYSYRFQATPPPVLSWTGETNYQNGGVNPASGPAGTSFEFRVKYQNTSGSRPQKFQVWIDQDDDGIYYINPASPIKDKIIDMEELGNNYLQGVIYKATTPVEYVGTGDGRINYRFVFSDGTNEATGEPTKSHQVLLGNSPPALEWMTTAGYESDGVSPDTAPAGTAFTFKVRYRDLENESPAVTEVWVDVNRNNTYEQDEKFLMEAIDTQSFSAGRGYQKSISCLYLPDSNTVGTVSIKYRFNFTCGNTPVAGEPANDHTFSLTPYLSVPVLSWVSEPGFTKGVRFRGEAAGKNYEFQISYQDQDNDLPATQEVWIDENGDNNFSQNEKHVMEALTPSDTVTADGKIYRLLINIVSSAAGSISYKFVFSDGKNMAIGEPFLSVSQLAVSSPVYLTWTGEQGYLQDGVNPDSGPGRSQFQFQFQVQYVNLHDFPPKTKKLWLDVNNDGIYQGAEVHDMEELDPLDMVYSDGKIYTKSLSIVPSITPPVSLKYQFIFQDIYSEEATGEPAQGLKSVLVLDPNALADPNTPDPDSDPNSPDDPDGTANPADLSHSSTSDVHRELKSSQGGCFIRSLLKRYSLRR
ncbi:MAG: hypothetical protein AB1611_21350 [bacterium]